MRKLASIFLIITIFVFSFVMPFLKVSSFSYASDDSIYIPLRSESDLVKAFQAYCKSRDLTIEGSAADLVTTFTTSIFNGICNTVGIDITQLQAEIKAEYDQTGKPVKFLYNSTGIGLMNRVFAQFLQDNELSVGDENVNKVAYDGKYLEGSDALIYITSKRIGSIDSFIQRGSYYLYDNQTLVNGAGNNFNYQFNNQVYSYPVTSTTSSNGSYHQTRLDGAFIGGETSGYTYNGYMALCYSTYNNQLYMGIYVRTTNTNTGAITEAFANKVAANSATQQNIHNTTINIVSNTINNNNYEGDTIINNDGDVIINEPDPDPDPEPDPGYDPYPGGGGTTTDPDQTGGGDGDDDTDITFPNFNFDLPSINWSLGDLSQKFPFSIPFDLIAFFTVLNAEPEAPAIDANIPLGSWYTWHFQADFSQFNNYAVIIRNVEFIAFCVGLIYLTIKFVKG